MSLSNQLPHIQEPNYLDHDLDDIHMDRNPEDAPFTSTRDIFIVQ